MVETELKTFPSTKFEALALLYVQSQDLSSKTPSEVLDMYHAAHKEMREHQSEMLNNKTYSF